MADNVPVDAVLADIAEMMSEFVDNWPEPKRIDTALALIAKTMRAALDENETDALERAIDRMGWAEINAFNERAYQDVYEDAGGFILRKIKRLFGIRRDPVLTYQEAARAMLAARARLTDTDLAKHSAGQRAFVRESGK